jgi:glycerol kinase
VPAFSGLFAPYWRADARSAIVGLSRFHTSAHLARATLRERGVLVALSSTTPRSPVLAAGS